MGTGNECAFTPSYVRFHGVWRTSPTGEREAHKRALRLLVILVIALLRAPSLNVIWYLRPPRQAANIVSEKLHVIQSNQRGRYSERRISPEIVSIHARMAQPGADRDPPEFNFKGLGSQSSNEFEIVHNEISVCLDVPDP